MADVTITERSRLVLSWGVFLAMAGLLALAVETRLLVSMHTQQISEIQQDAKGASVVGATKNDIERLEGRIIRIETLLLSQQPRAGR